MQNRYDFILSVVKEAGSMLLKYHNQQVETISKNGDPLDLVTKADFEIGDFLTKKIREAFPAEAIYSEEAKGEDISSGSFWSLDPIDGTTNFARSIPHFAVVVTYIENGEPVVGAIYNPITKDLFSFEKGKGAFLNNESIRVSNKRDLENATVLLRVGRNEELWDWGMDAYRFFLKNKCRVSNLGSSGLDTCYVAAGRVEANIYGTLTTMDVAAALGLLHEAGGIVVGKGGLPVVTLSKERQQIIAVNSREILEAITPIVI